MKLVKGNKVSYPKSRSIYCWVEKLEDGKDIELHFNLWLTSNPILDIGIMAHNKSGKITVCIPVVIDGADVVCINNVLCRGKNRNLVFNDYMVQTNPDHDGQYQIITNEEKTKEFGILEKDSVLRSIEKNGVTWITIDVPECKTEKVYFRLRIKGKSIKDLYTIKQPTSGVLQDTQLLTTLLDFRVNDVRTKPSDIEESTIEKMCVMVCHLLIMLPKTDDIQMSSTKYSSRLLETEIWEDYLANDTSIKDDVIAYHWKIKNDGDVKQDISIMCKMNKQKCLIWKLIAYLIIAFGIGVDASLLAYLISLLLS